MSKNNKTVKEMLIKIIDVLDEQQEVDVERSAGNSSTEMDNCPENSTTGMNNEGMQHPPSSSVPYQNYWNYNVAPGMVPGMMPMHPCYGPQSNLFPANYSTQSCPYPYAYHSEVSYFPEYRGRRQRRGSRRRGSRGRGSWGRGWNGYYGYQ